MKNKKRLLLLAVIPIAVLAWFRGEQAERSLQRLQAEGFAVDQRIDTVPPLVVDRRQRRLALIDGERYVTFGFDQVRSMEQHIDMSRQHLGPSLLVLNLQRHPQAAITLRARDDVEVLLWQQQLQRLLAE